MEIEGIGGSASYYKIDGRVEFKDETDVAISYLASMLIAERTKKKGRGRQPSILGQDVLRQLTLVQDYAGGRLELRP